MGESGAGKAWPRDDVFDVAAYSAGDWDAGGIIERVLANANIEARAVGGSVIWVVEVRKKDAERAVQVLQDARRLQQISHLRIWGDEPWQRPGGNRRRKGSEAGS